MARAWLKRDLREPTRDQAYQMQVAVETRRIWRLALTKFPKKMQDDLWKMLTDVKIKDMRLSFGSDAEKSKADAVPEPISFPVSKQEMQAAIIEAQVELAGQADRGGAMSRLTPQERHEKLVSARVKK